MGHAKRLMMEEMERGYSYSSDETICPSCVTDDCLQAAISAEMRNVSCSFCGATGSADFEVLLEQRLGTINFYFDDPANVLGYNSREGGYLGETFDGYDLVGEQLDEFSEDDNVIQSVKEAFSGGLYCSQHAYDMDRYQVLSHSWQNFSTHLKYNTRYLFHTQNEPSEYDHQQIPVGRILEQIGDLFTEHLKKHTFTSGNRVFRARVLNPKENVTTAAEMGSPPRRFATLPNRMSPAGISMFYGAINRDTAIQETYSPSNTSKKIAIATFSFQRSVHVLDLTSKPSIPSMYNVALRPIREAIRFVHEFVHDLRRPVDRKSTPHIDYVPTQVVTEYIRHLLPARMNIKIEGIQYQSAQPGGGKAVVLFFDSNHFRSPRYRGLQPKQVLKLEQINYVKP